MADTQGIRKLAAILSADAAGYSRLMGDDDAATVETLTAYRKIFAANIERHFGRLVDTPGDNLLAEFASPVEAVECAAAIQRQLAEQNALLDAHRRMEFRIGINQGDVIARDGALYGDGVNIAARLEALSEPGGICISGKVFDEIKTKVTYGLKFIGKQEVKNIHEPVRAYRVLLDGQAMAGPDRSPQSRPSGRRRRVAGIGIVAAVVLATAGGGTYWQLDRLAPKAVETATTSAVPDYMLKLPDGPSIAVLPFRNGSGDPAQEYFSDGISEDLIIALSRFSNLFVFGRNTSFQFKGQNIGARQIGEALGVRYVLDGSVRKTEVTLRVSAELTDTSTGEILWADSFEGDLTADSIFGVEDDITGQVASMVASSSGALMRADLEASKSKAPSDLTAYECVLRTYAYLQSFSPQGHIEVRDCLTHAVETEPDYVDAWTWLAASYLDEFRFGYNPEPEPLDRAMTTIRRAIELDPTSQNARWILATILFHRHELDAFMAEAERTVELNPNNPTALAGIGIYMAYAGDWTRGLALVRKAAALDPNHPGWFHFAFFHDHFRNRNYEAALAEAKRIDSPNFFRMHLVQAAAYAALDRQAEAEAAVGEVLRLKPGYNLGDVEAFYRMFNMTESVSKQILQALRTAGLPEGAPPATN